MGMVIFHGLVLPLFIILVVLLLRKWPLRGEQCEVSQAFSGQIKVVCKNKVAVWWSSFVAGSLPSKRDHDYCKNIILARNKTVPRRIQVP